MLKKATRIFMGVLYAAAGINHFVNPDFYVKIMPPWMPWHLPLVWLSGVAEIVLGVAVMFRRTAPWAAWGIILMLLAFMAVHIEMALRPDDYGVPAALAYLRIPLQFLLIAWAWWYTRD